MSVVQGILATQYNPDFKTKQVYFLSLSIAIKLSSITFILLSDPHMLVMLLNYNLRSISNRQAPFLTLNEAVSIVTLASFILQ